MAKHFEFNKRDAVIVIQFVQNVIIPNGFASEKDVDEWLRSNFAGDDDSVMSQGNPLAEFNPPVVTNSLKWRLVFTGLMDTTERKVING